MEAGLGAKVVGSWLVGTSSSTSLPCVQCVMPMVLGLPKLEAGH